MRKIVSIEHLKEQDVIAENIIILNSLLKNKFEEGFIHIPENVEIHENFYSVFYQFSKQILLEKIVNDLSNLVDVNIKIATKDLDKKVYHVLGYSKPTNTKMFIIHLCSTEYGITDFMSVSFFNSIEEMYLYLMKYYNLFKNRNVYILEEENYAHTIETFYSLNNENI